MNFFEAMACMKEGCKVKVKSWDKEDFIGLKEERYKVFGKERVKYSALTASESELSPAVSFSTLLSAEWERHED